MNILPREILNSLAVCKVTLLHLSWFPFISCQNYNIEVWLEGSHICIHLPLRGPLSDIFLNYKSKLESQVTVAIPEFLGSVREGSGTSEDLYSCSQWHLLLGFVPSRPWATCAQRWVEITQFPREDSGELCLDLNIDKFPRHLEGKRGTKTLSEATCSFGLWSSFIPFILPNFVIFLGRKF